MPAWILKLLKWLPGVGGILDKLNGNATRIEEIRAETEQADIRGFHRTGRISAAHAWKYAKVLIAVALAIAFCAMLFFPSAGRNAVDLLDAFVAAVVKLFTVEM